MNNIKALAVFCFWLGWLAPLMKSVEEGAIRCGNGYDEYIVADMRLCVEATIHC